MFKPKTLRVLAMIAIGVCCIATLLSLIIALEKTGIAYISVFSWAVLAYGSYCAMKLTGYDIYESDLRKLGWNIYILFAIFVAFLFVGLSVGPLIALGITWRLHFQKTAQEEWLRDNPQS